jgi:hypothetical protein
MTRIRVDAEKEVKAFVKRLVANNPEAAGLSATATVRVFTKRPKGFENFERDVVQLMLLGDRFLSMSNADLAAHMSGKYEGFVVSPSAFYSPLKPWAKKGIGALLSQFDKRIDLSGKPTLSSIKKVLRGDQATKKPRRDYDARFSFTDDHVVVNGRSHRITVTKQGYRRFRVGEQWLPVETLEALLRKPQPPFLSE